MNYFENIFKNAAGRNEKIGLSNVKLNHPVLYIFLSEEENAVDIIDKINALYETKLKDASGVKYLCFHNNVKLAKEALHDIQSGYLRREYANPIYRRVYIVFHTNDLKGISVKSAVELADGFFRSVNNTPLIDVFAITDERLALSEDKREVISGVYKELIELRRKCNMIYLLSNLTSSHILIDEFDDHYTAIVLSSLLKDCSAAASSRDVFDEKTFKENCRIQNENGYFYTIGTKKIDSPADILSAVVIREMTDGTNPIYIKDIQNMLKEFNALKDKLFSDVEILYDECIGRCSLHVSSLAFNLDEMERTYITNGETLDGIFGKKSVDTFFEINVREETDFDAITEIVKGFAEKCLKNMRNGFFATKKLLEVLIDEVIPESELKLEKGISERKKQLENWLESGFKSNSREKIGLFSKIYLYPFELAREYISLKGDLAKFPVALKALKVCGEELGIYLNNINEICEKLEESEKYLSSYITNKLSAKPVVIKENFENYYKSKASEYINNNYSDFFESVYKDFYPLGKENIGLLFDKCVGYAGKIMNSNGFNQNIYDEIFSRILSGEHTQFDTREKISEQLFKEILSDRVYFCSLLFREGLYENTCLITGNGGFTEKLGKNAGQNIFFDETDKMLNIIYMTGAFGPENLFYAKQYGFGLER